MIAWFDNGSCCVINTDASRFVSNHIAASWCFSKDLLRLDTLIFLKDASMTLEKDVTQRSFSPNQDDSKLPAACSALNKNIMIQLQHSIKSFSVLAKVLEGLHTGTTEENIRCCNQAAALTIVSDLAKLPLVETNDRQKFHRDRATVLLAISAEMRPAISRSEWIHIGNLKRLATQTALASARVKAEIKRIHDCSSKLHKDITQGELKLAAGFLAKQMKFLRLASHSVVILLGRMQAMRS